ncbi:Retrotransposable element Tf2 155 kDa protein type 3 [Talaromyces islandicus]|uniref:Retrotransposable element Tf2 155 kDa protein type 3 n=1 Tax=Talaromyces islandicus TaxID=28573 RepID=A0A0U1LYV8_TALIS|nr:Retrotransposable element Tf2 155 kDa protein type 3 [Talaromyces islandicus]
MKTRTWGRRGLPLNRNSMASANPTNPSAATGCIGTNRPCTAAEPRTENPINSSHAEKRPRTDTIPAEKRPSRFKLKDLYGGKTLTELETFIGRAESWFDRYPEWYNQYPHHKVGEASDNLNSKQFLNFNIYRKEREPEQITWEDFKAHLRRLFHDPELLRIAATRDHNDARQLEGQSVWEFARYLRTLEDQMDMQYTEEQRMKLLMVKVLRPIQDESQKYSEKPRTYEGTVQFLQKLEDAMPERQKIRNARRRDGQSSNGNEHRAVTNHRRAGARTPADKRGKYNQFPRRDEITAGRSSGENPKGRERGRPRSDQTRLTCNYCGKVGHWEKECYKKGFDTAALGIARENDPGGEQLLIMEAELPKLLGTAKVRTLIDSGAQGNFVNRKLAEKFPGIAGIAPRRVKAIDGRVVRTYGQHHTDIRVKDSNGLTRTSGHTLYTVDIDGYDMILDLRLYAARILEGDDGARTIETPPDVETFESDGLPLPDYLSDYADVFSEAAAGMLPEHAEHDHAIDLEPGTTPPHKPIYRLTETEREVLRDYLSKAQEKGWIRPSKSPAGAPILFVPKKDGELRLCVDYRGLNAITVKNRYPIPLVMETLDRFAGAKYFTKLDLKDAYHRIRIRTGDEWKTAFRTRYGHFEYQVMPFGLANALATFQAYVNKAMSDLLDTCVVVYLDDIVIYSTDLRTHEAQVREVMSRLRSHSLYCKRSKCSFGMDTIEYLGFIIGPQGITMDQERVRTIAEWPEPRSVKEVQSFLGFANFYRNFIPQFSRISTPLSELTKGPAGRAKRNSHKSSAISEFYMTPEARESFLNLKQAFQCEPVLRHYNPALPICIETDASGGALGAVITQLFEDTQWHPIAYWSRKLQGPEVRYEVHDSELLAIIEAFRHWRQYLEGSRHTIRVLTDHSNLRYFATTKELSRHQARWAEYLSAFDFNIEYRPGSKNPADAPSRRPDYMDGVEEDTTTLPTLQRKLQMGHFGKQEQKPISPQDQVISANMLAQGV